MTTIPSQPHSLEAERTVLGALLLDPDAIVKVAGILNPDDFHDPVHGSVYESIRNLHEARESVDFVTVSEKLKSNAQIQSLGGSAFLARFAHDVPTSSHIEQYAAIVRDRSLKRQAIRLAKVIEETACDPKQSAEDVVDAAERGVLKVSRQITTESSFDHADLSAERYEHYHRVYRASPEEKQAMYGLSTGFLDLDRLHNGMAANDLIIIAGRPGMGKTAFVLNVARHVTDTLSKKVMFLSLEMSKEQVEDRIHASDLGVSVQDLTKGMIRKEVFESMGDVFSRVRRGYLHIDDECDSTIDNLCRKARRQKMEQGLDLLIVDYLQLLTAGGRVSVEYRVGEISAISRKLKQLARELKIPVLAVSQLSRSVENRMDKRPLLSDLRESGSIEQDADTVIMLYRDDYYNEDSESPGMTEVLLRKQRQGATGRVELQFDREQMRFQNRARQESEHEQAVMPGAL